MLRVALAVADELRENPWLGKGVRSRLGLVELANCRRVAFDRQDHAAKPRFRLLYRNEPSGGPVHLVAVLSAAPRQDLDAYRRANKPRLIERIRLQSGRIDPRGDG